MVCWKRAAYLESSNMAVYVFFVISSLQIGEIKWSRINLLHFKAARYYRLPFWRISRLRLSFFFLGWVDGRRKEWLFHLAMYGKFIEKEVTYAVGCFSKVVKFINIVSERIACTVGLKNKLINGRVDQWALNSLNYHQRDSKDLGAPAVNNELELRRNREHDFIRKGDCWMAILIKFTV